MNRTRGFVLVSLLAMAVLLASSSIVLSAIAQDQGTAPDPQLPPRDPPWMSQLTDDQKAQIQQLIQSMKDSGASNKRSETPSMRNYKNGESNSLNAQSPPNHLHHKLDPTTSMDESGHRIPGQACSVLEQTQSRIDALRGRV